MHTLLPECLKKSVKLLTFVWASAFLLNTIGEEQAFAQEVDFGSFDTYSLNVFSMAGQDELDFGTAFAGEGLIEVTLGAPEMAVVAIEGVETLDVFVTIDALPYLSLTPDNPSSRLDFTVNAAFANRGAANSHHSYAREFIGGYVRFPMLRRTDGPPGPPPTPPNENYTPPMETAYLFIYGSINAQQGLNAGQYTGVIEISVTYDL